MRILSLLGEVLTWTWVASCIAAGWSRIALTIAREIRPFMPAVWVLLYLYRTVVDGAPTGVQIMVLVVSVAAWFFTRLDDDDRWTRRRKRLGRRVRAIAGGRRLVTT